MLLRAIEEGGLLARQRGRDFTRCGGVRIRSRRTLSLWVGATRVRQRRPGRGPAALDRSLSHRIDRRSDGGRRPIGHGTLYRCHRWAHQVIGDDFLATSAVLVQRAARECTCNAVLIAESGRYPHRDEGGARRGKRAGFGTIVSAFRRNRRCHHRSLEHRMGCSQLKGDARARSASAKWNEVLRIEEAQGPRALCRLQRIARSTQHQARMSVPSATSPHLLRGSSSCWPFSCSPRWTLWLKFLLRSYPLPPLILRALRCAYIVDASCRWRRAWGVRSLLRTKRPGLQVMRGLLLVGAQVVFLRSRYLPLAEAAAITFVAP